MTETREIGVGLISVGWMGKLHTRAYQAMPSVYPELGLKCRLVIAADTAPDRVEYAKDVLGYERGTTDYREVLADPDVDVVSICAPNMLHREIGIAAAKAGKPFWIEKPVGRDARGDRRGRRRRPRGRRRHLHRLQLPPRPGDRAHARADRRRHPGPDHQHPLGVPQRLRLRAQGRAVVALPEGVLRQRRYGRPAQPRRRPGAVRRRPDRRGHRPVLDHPRRAAHPADGLGHPLRGDRGRRDGPRGERGLRRRARPVRAELPRCGAPSAPWSAPGWSSGRSADSRSRSTAPKARPSGTSSG